MGSGAVECLGRTVQEFDEKLRVDFRPCESETESLFYPTDAEAISHSLKRYQMSSIRPDQSRPQKV